MSTLDVVVITTGDFWTIAISRAAIKQWDPDLLAKMIAMDLKRALASVEQGSGS